MRPLELHDGTNDSDSGHEVFALRDVNVSVAPGSGGIR